jgi:imidazolonepropionase-like amidohydrolase
MNRTCLLAGLAMLALLPTGNESATAQDHDLALVGGTIYASPTAAALTDATLLIHGKTIAAVGKSKEIAIPKSARVLACTGKVITAGFWNSHVHFETGWANAHQATPGQLETAIEEMLTRWGFTTVWDLGSNPQNTLTLRKRVESGEVPGPRILMAGDIFPKNGHPVYLPAAMQLTEAATPGEAAEESRQYLELGLDGIKLFTGAFMGNQPVVNMDTAIVKGAVSVAHEKHKPVFAHPQNRAGVDNALAGGVDVLAHTIPSEMSFTADEIEAMRTHQVALIPTLTLWTTVVSDVESQKRMVGYGIAELRQYSSVGGTILFGTDVGFQSGYDTTQEYEFMGRAMSWREILASLTTNPSEFFQSPTEGRVAKGMRADLVVLDGDPAQDVKNFAKVSAAIRDGKVIYSATETK